MHIQKVNIISAILVILSFVMYVSLDGGFAIDRFLAIGGVDGSAFDFSVFIRKSIYIVEYICAFGIIVTLIYYNNLKGLIGLLGLSLLFFIDSCCFAVYGCPADVFNISMLIDSAANIKDAISMYFSVICKEGVLTILCFLPVFVCWYLNKGKDKIMRGGIIILMMLFLFSIYFATVVFRGGTVIKGFPKGYSFLFGCVTVELNKIFAKKENAEEIKFSVPADVRNILFIVDESIEYNEISKKIKKIMPSDYFFDFGKTISAANCSATSNYILRKAVQENISGKYKLLETKSVFQIARENKYDTYYIDAQGVLNDKNVKNYFTEQEIKYIDNIIDISSIPLIDRDRTIPDIVQRINNTEHKKFIFINKVGAHFPYNSHLPFSDITKNNINNYRKVLDRNVVYVVKQLIDKIDEKTVIFYTSDHGQNFDGGATHCNSGNSIRKEEYYVPFFIITKNKYISDKINATTIMHPNHFYITESVRNLLGEEIVGAPSIFKSNKDGNSDNIKTCGIWGQPIKFFGKEPYCIEF